MVWSPLAPARTRNVARPDPASAAPASNTPLPRVSVPPENAGVSNTPPICSCTSPPALITVPTPVPPEATIWVPPLATLVALTISPAETISVPPLPTALPLATAPMAKFSWPP